MQKIVKQNNQTKVLDVIDSTITRLTPVSEHTDEIAICSCIACATQAQAMNIVNEEASSAASTSVATAETADNVTTYTLNIGDGNTTINYPKDNIKLVFNEVNADEVTYELTDSTSGTLILTYGNGDTLTFKNFFWESTLYENSSIEAAFSDITLNSKAFLDAANIQYWVKNLSTGRIVNSGEYSNTGKHIVYYSFPNQQPDYFDMASIGVTDTEGDKWSSFGNHQKELVERIFSDIEKSVNIQFIETADVNQRHNIAFQNIDNGAHLRGKAFYPSYAGTGISSDVYIGVSAYSEEAVSSGEVNHTYVHEILHALGLSHSFGKYRETLISAEEVTPWTVMSYSYKHPDQSSVDKLLNFDMAALQALYGVNENARTGNDTYTFDNSIGQLVWDGAGTDTIDASEQTNKVTINLNDGAWSYVGNARAENISEGNQLAINISTTIENAKGGLGNDTLIGNKADNHLYGNSGNDSLNGLAGSDTLLGYHGNDQLYGDDGNDWLYGNYGDDKLYGNNGDDKLYGQNGNDWLYGGNGTDKLSGGVGEDRLHGGYGQDELYGGNNQDWLYGGYGNDRLYGNNDDDQLYGQGGSDRLYGNNGNDRLSGGVGDDRLHGDSGNDELYGGDNNDWIYGGYGNDKLYGNAGDDRLYGQIGDNELMGGDGNDKIWSGSGNDKIWGNNGDDIFTFNTLLGKDEIQDFTSGNDSIQIAQTAVTQLLTGRLSSSNFAANNNGVATDSNDFIIYNTSTGELSYDADGSGSGVAYTFATLANHAALTHNDIVIT